MKNVKKPSLKSIAKKLDNVRQRGPLWLGPEDNSEKGGISQSMINAFLCCRERFRLKNIEGLQPPDRFSASIDFGTLFHLCEEYWSGGKDWESGLKNEAQKYCLKYPLQQDEVNKWWQVCKTIFPIYVDYWKKDLEQKNRTPLLQEYKFHVPYELPSGRTVYLRGKFDGVDIIGKGKDAGIYLFETKTKSDIDESRISRNLRFDLQTMLYLVALNTCQIREAPPLPAHPIKGVRYNCIRRPLSGGKGSIRPHQATAKKAAESQSEFYARLKDVILEDVDTYFLRLKVDVFPSDIEKFKKICLNPILEQICNWYEWAKNEDPFDATQGGEIGNHIHYMSPFGLYNPLIEQGQTDLDEYILNGNEVGLQRIDSLFPELQ